MNRDCSTFSVWFGYERNETRNETKKKNYVWIWRYSNCFASGFVARCLFICFCVTHVGIFLKFILIKYSKCFLQFSSQLQSCVNFCQFNHKISIYLVFIHFHNAYYVKLVWFFFSFLLKLPTLVSIICRFFFEFLYARLWSRFVAK